MSSEMSWDVRPELMAEILASIVPVRTDVALGKVLADDFPRDCAALPISGGWGYSQTDAIAFVRSRFPIPAAADFVPLEYHIVQKIIYEELIIFRPKDYKFSGITKKLKRQTLIEDNEKKYDRLEFLISCWSDWHWNQLHQEWDANDFGLRPGFDQNAHASKREASQVTYEREFWFDVSDVFDRAPADRPLSST
jgi:hypothetical protein